MFVSAVLHELFEASLATQIFGQAWVFGCAERKMQSGTTHVRVYQQDTAGWLANDDLAQIARNKLFAFVGDSHLREGLFLAAARARLDRATERRSKRVRA